MENINICPKDINNVELIQEIEIRPILYDTNVKEYTDLREKNRMWTQVCGKILGDKWQRSAKHEKTNAVRMVQNRWKNIRTSFSREFRLQKLTMAGCVKKKQRKYLYFNHLRFLIPYLKCKPLSDIDEPNESDDDDNDKKDFIPEEMQDELHEELHEELLEELQAIHSPLRVPSTQPTEEEYSDNEDVDNPLELLQGSNDPSTANCSVNCKDHETLFALSLVPMLKLLPHAQKFDVQIQILHLFKNATAHAQKTAGRAGKYS